MDDTRNFDSVTAKNVVTDTIYEVLGSHGVMMKIYVLGNKGSVVTTAIFIIQQ